MCDVEEITGWRGRNW